MAETFTAQIRNWEKKTTRALEMVFKQSTQDVFSKAQTPVALGGNMPVDTGNLRNTFISGLNGSTALTGPDAYVLTVAQARLGDVIFGGWTAAYAPRIEFGFVGSDRLGRVYNQPGRGYARKAAMQWTEIVKANVRKAKAITG